MDDDAIYAARTELVDYCIDCFWDVPSEAFVERLLSGELQVPAESVNSDLDKGFSLLESFVENARGADPETVCTRLEREYTRVFVGPRPPVLAHETYYRDDADYLGEGLATVEASYAAAGWNPPENYGEENDFVAVELAFLRHLIDRQRRGDEETFGYERVFLDEHLLRWTDAFVADLRENTDEPFYRAAGHVFAGLAEFEDELVAQLV